MARFPNREPEIMVLAQDMATGFKANPDVFPNPPYGMDELAQWIADYTAARDANGLAQAKASEALAQKQHALETLTDGMKGLLRYAETRADNDQQLALVGWSGRSAPAALQAPGQPRLLEVARQGEGWVSIDWKPALDGGKPAAYNVQRRQLPDGACALSAMAIDAEATLTDQPRGLALEFRVLAVNRAGTSEASNTVTASL